MNDETKTPEYQTIKAHKETYEYLRLVAFKQRQPMVTILQWWADKWRESEGEETAFQFMDERFDFEE